MTEHKLVVEINHDDDSTAGLTGTLEINGFKGYGEGWFNLTEIKQFIKELKKMAKSHKGKAELIGGQSKPDGSNYLERFGLRCYAIGSTGVFGVHVTLSHYPFYDCRNEEVLKVSGELISNSRLILNFVEELDDLFFGNDKTAILLGKTNYSGN